MGFSPKLEATRFKKNSFGLKSPKQFLGSNHPRHKCRGNSKEYQQPTQGKIELPRASARGKKYLKEIGVLTPLK